MDPIVKSTTAAALAKARNVLTPQAPIHVLVENAPFAKLLADGKRSLVVKSKRFDIADEPLFLGDTDQAYAIITVGRPFAMTIKQFKERYDDHLISDELRKKFWSGVRRLWGYPVNKVDVLQQPQLFVGQLAPGLVYRPRFQKAVENPTEAQRKDLPDAAFAWVGEGTDGRRRRILPHHVNTVSNPKENSSVDTPRLRNAFARFDQVKGVSASALAMAKAHLNAHAKEVLPSRKAEEIEAMTIEEVVKHLTDVIEGVDQAPPMKKVVTKSGVFILAGEAGAHPHILATDNDRTESDGPHSHLFKLPDDTLVSTRVDGAHTHDWAKGASRTPGGGQHKHTLLLPNGTKLDTSESIGHAHDLMVRTTGLDGVHDHEVTLLDGTGLKTLSAAEFRDLTQSATERIMDKPDDATTRGEKVALADGRPVDIKLYKQEVSDTDERFVLGVVLEPDIVDSQGDTYSEEEVRKAAHFWMEKFARLKLMHKGAALGKRARILESYVAPAAFTVGDTTIKKGTWLLAIRVLASDLWADIKKGVLTGFSIGGTALFELLDEKASFGLNSPGA